jgi:hypothetical protein
MDIKCGTGVAVNVTVGGTVAVDVDVNGTGVRVRADVGAGAAKTSDVCCAGVQLVTSRSARYARKIGLMVFSNKRVTCV